MLHGETIHSPAPWDVPFWDPSHFVFFSVLYAVLGLLCLGLVIIFVRSYFDVQKHDAQ